MAERESFEQRYPESLGAGTETAAGGVAYGVDPGLRAIVPPARPAWERDADMARARDGCPRCSEVPAEVITALVAALRAAKGRQP
jgi:hypothetical protein